MQGTGALGGREHRRAECHAQRLMFVTWSIPNVLAMLLFHTKVPSLDPRKNASKGEHQYIPAALRVRSETVGRWGALYSRYRCHHTQGRLHTRPALPLQFLPDLSHKES